MIVVMASRVLTFLKPWGIHSWLVSYDGPWDSGTGGLQHVEVGILAMENYSPGQTFFLSNLHVAGEAFVCDINTYINNKRHEVAHFIVAYGRHKRPMQTYL